MQKKINALFCILVLTSRGMNHDVISDDLTALEKGQLPPLHDSQSQLNELTLIAHIKNKDFESFKAAYEEIERINNPDQMRNLLTGRAAGLKSGANSSSAGNSLLATVDLTQSQTQKEVTGVTAKKTLISLGCVVAAVLQYYAQSTGQQTAATPAPNASAGPTAGSSSTSFTIPNYIILASIGIESAIEMIKKIVDYSQNNNLAQIRQLLKEQQDFYLSHQQLTSPIHQPTEDLVHEPAKDEKPMVKKKHRRTKKKFKGEIVKPN